MSLVEEDDGCRHEEPLSAQVGLCIACQKVVADSWDSQLLACLVDDFSQPGFSFDEEVTISAMVEMRMYHLPTLTLRIFILV